MIDRDVFRQLGVRIPVAVLVPMVMVVAIGIVNLSSAAQATRPDLYLSQLSKFGMASLLMMAVGMIHTRVLRQMAYVLFSFCCLLLLLVLIIGTSAKGSQRWLVLGSLRLQPSDPAKIALVLALARYCSLYWPDKGYTLYTLCRPLNLSRPLGFLLAIVFILVKERHGSEFLSNEFLTSHLGMAVMGGLLLVGLIWLFLSIMILAYEEFNFTSLIAPIDIPIVPFLLILVETDLGTALIIFAIAGMMFLFVGIRSYSLIFGAVCGFVISVAAYFTILKDYQKQRITSFLDPQADLQGEGYHAMQSIIAIGSGRVSGKGFGGGTQTQLSFLPENATDFVFSVWAEEWGLVASVFLLLLYFLTLWSILRLATRVEDKFSQLVCVGVAASIFIHVLINVGMVTGVMPVVGVPLPLMSYGGSAMFTTLIGIGLVVNVALWRGAK